MTTLLFSSVSFADDNKDQLKAIKGKIDEQKSLLAKQKKQQQRLQNLLRDTDKKIATAANDLYKTQQQQKTAQREQAALVTKKQTLKKTQAHQQDVLAKQLKSAYMTGNHDLMQLLLNQEQSGKTERLLGYYQYLNKARVEAIDELKQTVAALQDVEAQLVNTLAVLDNLLKQQQQAQAALKKEKQTRSNALAQLQKSYRANSAQLEQYQLSELDIKQLIKTQREAAQARPTEKPLKGLAKVRGRLTKPTKGRTTHSFGQKRSGQLRWKGVTLVGKEGQPVNAVYHGKVVFSDWLKGFGLVLVVDHGNGYMSLYGHNQALLKKAGDYVGQNEQIALLGQSGGQASPGLYFEIRHKGKAINPTRWFKK